MNANSRRWTTVHLQALGVVLIASSPLAAQAGQLPPWRIGAVASAMGRAEVETALLEVLNSPGDTMELRVDSSASLLGVGAGVGMHFNITRAADGSCEVVLGDEAVLSLGLEAFEGLEVAASGALAREVLFVWPNREQAAAALDRMATAHAVAADELVALLESQLQLFVHSVEALREAITATEPAQRIYEGLVEVQRAAEQALRHTRTALGKAVRKLRGVASKLRKLERRARRLPRWLRKWLRAPLRALSGARRAVEYSVRVARIPVRAAELVLEQAQRDVRGARAVLDHLFRQENHARAVRESALDSLHHTQQLIDAVVSVPSELASHLAGVSYTLSAGVEASAAVGPFPGAQVENLGMGSAGELDGGFRVAYRVGTAGELLELTKFLDLEVATWAGFGVGVRSEFAAGTTITAAWLREPGEAVFGFDDLETGIRADGAVLGVVGAGVAVRHGVGEEVELSMTADQWRSAFDSWRDLARTGGFHSGTFVEALRGVPCSSRTTRRWIAALVASGGGSVAGTGVEFSASATWEDQGEPRLEDVDAGVLLERVLSNSWQAATVATLTPHL